MKKETARNKSVNVQQQIIQIAPLWRKRDIQPGRKKVSLKVYPKNSYAVLMLSAASEEFGSPSTRYISFLSPDLLQNEIPWWHDMD